MISNIGFGPITHVSPSAHKADHQGKTVTVVDVISLHFLNRHDNIKYRPFVQL